MSKAFLIYIFKSDPRYAGKKAASVQKSRVASRSDPRYAGKKVAKGLLKLLLFRVTPAMRGRK